jgi:hypothetical protein
MTLLGCRRCGARFSVGADMCPQCTSTDAYEVGSQEDPNVAKATSAGVSDTEAPADTVVTRADGEVVEVDTSGASQAEVAEAATGAEASAAEGPERPAAGARKQEVVDYVRALGFTDVPEDGKGYTVDQLWELADDAAGDDVLPPTTEPDSTSDESE